MPDQEKVAIPAEPHKALDFSLLVFKSKQPKIFADIRDNTEDNRHEWLDGIKAAHEGDAPGVLRALFQAKGRALLLNSRGKPARNPIAAQARKLLANPHAWSRLMESQPFWSYERDPNDFPEARIYRRDDTSASALLWTISPETVAQAASLWRAELEQSHKFLSSSPFFHTIWDGPIELACWISAPAARHFDPSDDAGPKRSSAATPDLAPDPIERQCLARILTELARASIQERFPGHLRAAREREAQPEKSHSINHSWAAGLRWHASNFDISSPGEPPRTPLESAVDALIHEAKQSSYEAFFEKCRLSILACVEGGAEPLAKRALGAWLGANPDTPNGLPLLEFDSLRPAQLDRILPNAPFCDAALGRWLARTGKSWQTPATFGYSGRLEEASLQWGYRTTHVPDKLSSVLSATDLASWTVGEWLVGSRPAALREACLAGYTLARGLEAALTADKSGYVSPTRIPETLAVIEACRLASASIPTDARAKRRNSI